MPIDVSPSIITRMRRAHFAGDVAYEACGGWGNFGVIADLVFGIHDAPGLAPLGEPIHEGRIRRPNPALALSWKL